MKQRSLKNGSTLTQRFKQLIETLRNKTNLDGKPHLSFEDPLKPTETHLDPHIADILPTTLTPFKHNNDSKDHEKNSFNLSPQPSDAAWNQEVLPLPKKRDSEIEI
jgi:hypothetical protein